MQITRVVGVGASVTAVALSLAFSPMTSAQDADVVDDVVAEVVAVDEAISGDGGVAAATADGGAIIIGDLNSGLNTGNVILVGVLE